MEIISIDFFVFILISCAIHYFVPEKLKSVWLLLVSIVFYISWDVRYFCVLLVLILTNYWLLVRIQNSRIKKPFIYGIFILNIGLFVLIKILSGTLTNSTIAGTAINQNLVTDTLLFPIGFSYYMLQMISFQLDVTNKRITVPTFFDFSLFFFYFPKLLSGPIEKPNNFLPRLGKQKKNDGYRVIFGINLIFIGLIRKLFIANILSTFMPSWQNDINFIGWAHILGFVIYVYNDFAGYTLIVRGVSCFFGIELSPNFHQPLLSRSFAEFWNRWHITLSTWLRENIYFPLSRKLNRIKNIHLGREMAYLIPPMVTMIASGFWHGASIALLLWGFVFGLFMIMERILFERWPAIQRSSSVGFGAWFSKLIVFVLFSFGMVPLATNWTTGTLKVWRNLFSEAGFQMNDAVIPVLLLGLFSFVLDYASEKSGKEIWWEDLHVIPRSAIVAFGILLIIISIILIYFYPSSVFIYQGF